MTDTSQFDLGRITIQVNGPVTQVARAYAVAKIAALAKLTPSPVLNVHLNLSVGGPEGASAAASMDVNGTSVRAHAQGTTLHEAADLLQARLRTRLVRHEDRRHPQSHKAHTSRHPADADDLGSVLHQQGEREAS